MDALVVMSVAIAVLAIMLVIALVYYWRRQ